jgi:hypothetical protein
MRKHARAVQWLTFLPNFLVRYVAFYIALSIVRGDFRSAWAVLQGIKAFCETRRQTLDAGIMPAQSGPGPDVLRRVYADKDS